MYEDDIESVLLTEDQVQTKVRDLAAQISKDYAGRDVLLVGVLKGAFILMADLARDLTVPHEFDFMAVSSYGSATQTLARTAALAADERDWLDQLVAEALAATLAGGVDSQAPPHPPWATLPDGAPTTRGAGTARLDADALAALPVALARRVVRAAARQAGGPVPDAAATDRILGLPAD